MKLNFRRLKKVPVLVFDKERSSDLAAALLEKIEYEILPSRREEVYVNWRVLVVFIGLSLQFILKNIILNFKSLKSPKLLVRGLFLQYFKSVIFLIDPKVVLTYIDNSFFFQLCSKELPKIHFWAIQNGFRCELDVTRWLPNYPKHEKIFLQRFYCFGEFEKHLYARNLHDVKEFRAVGSIFLGQFLEQARSERIKEIYDICLISNYVHELGDKDTRSMARANIKLAGYLSKYQKENRLKTIVALRGNDSLEKDFYIKYFGDSVQFTDRRQNKFSTYYAILQSRLSLTFFSTVGFEALGMKQKIVFLNYSRVPQFSPSMIGPWFSSEEKYEIFKKVVTENLNMSKSEFNKITYDFQKYTMNVPLDSYTHRLIRKDIECVLNTIT
ncbi:hypothetical protein [Leptospira adleri]|uniref:Glycosyltransferase family 1 protein n=1 Tax=Leptospira adleri TaxID=2023186 RepID=A0A2M9YPG0_9LEPT|nr:hypothetical protein [Leptospira adleri]PJZ53380.1 hypothetical protein CH380_09275 [Leptospira adleri]PJZ61823.1 hypothetical protein CH376_11285 [Leptospira adleri]